MAKVVLIGCGYVGTRLAQRWRSRGVAVEAIVRTPASSQRLQALGIPATALDLDDGTISIDVDGAVVVYLAPPPSSGTRDTRIRRFLAALGNDRAAAFVLISTTGVYGDCGDAWVDEAFPVNPQADRARRRVDAERALGEWAGARGVRWTILRVPGIYGPGKLPTGRLREGKPVLREAESPWSNRVHVDDLVSACIAAAERGHGIYNVSDGHPSTMTDYFNQVADATGLPRPPQVSRSDAGKQLSEGMLSYLEESKRISNRRLREDLGVTIEYPDLASGLKASIASPE